MVGMCFLCLRTQRKLSHVPDFGHCDERVNQASRCKLLLFCFVVTRDHLGTA